MVTSITFTIPEDRGGTFIQNMGNHLDDYVVSQSRRTQLASVLP
jgi:hypothetical protein